MWVSTRLRRVGGTMELAAAWGGEQKLSGYLYAGCKGLRVFFSKI